VRRRRRPVVMRTSAAMRPTPARTAPALTISSRSSCTGPSAQERSSAEKHLAPQPAQTAQQRPGALIDREAVELTSWQRRRHRVRQLPLRAHRGHHKQADDLPSPDAPSVLASIAATQGGRVLQRPDHTYRGLPRQLPPVSPVSIAIAAAFGPLRNRRRGCATDTAIKPGDAGLGLQG
jgi:hypothetical protein